MQKLHWCAVFLGLSLAVARAQVTVEVVPNQDQYLPGEAVTVAVRVSNLSGQTLHLGADSDWLTITVQSKDGFLVSELKKLPVEGEFTLESSEVATKRLDIASGFELSRPGSYTVGATVNVKAWSQEFSAKPKPFSIVAGASLWEQTVGLPPVADHPNDRPQVRKYVLQQANYLKQLKLYVRITDADEGRLIKIFPAGPMISFSRPEAQVDKFSNLHVFWQTGARTFAYRVFGPDGETRLSQTHVYTDTRPRLVVGEDGLIAVKGGARQPTRDDFPAVTATSTVPVVPSTSVPTARGSFLPVSPQ